MKKFLSILKKILAGIIFLAIAVFIFLNMANYSTGFRAGVPIKISKKGVIIKTYEGQMNVGGLTTSSEGTIPTQFDFTVRKSADSVLTKIDDAILHGKRVKLHYNEKYVKFFWLGDTKHFVFDVEILE
jgi:hypothetical protein